MPFTSARYAVRENEHAVRVKTTRYLSNCPVVKIFPIQKMWA